MGRALAVLAVVTAVGSASAQPLAFQIKSEVSSGQKPLIRIRANVAAKDVRLELRRGDGKTFRKRRAALKSGETVTFEVGDGASGRHEWKASLSATVSGKGAWKSSFQFKTNVRGKLSIGYDRDHLYLDECRLEFKPSAEVSRATVVVYGEDGKELGKGAKSYSKGAANEWLPIKWKQPKGVRVMKMRLRVVATDGAVSNLELIPWSVTIDHEDVNFATGSAVIESAERDKLDASLDRINQIVRRSGRFLAMKLFIAGHTDTVGSAASNRKLSTARARAIATYFKGKGLTIPIAFAGFGEHVPAVATPDNTANADNRRVDYVLGPAQGAPPFKSTYQRAGVRWRGLR